MTNFQIPFTARFLRSLPAAVLLLASAVFAQQTSAPLQADAGLLSGSGPTFTVPAAGTPAHWSLIAYGDSRFTDPANTKDANPVVRKFLVDRIAKEHPDAVLFSGDVPLSGANPDDYRIYKEETAPWRDAHLHVYPALGNHELKGGDASLTNWWATFPELNHRRWYSVSFGAAYLILLDSDLPMTAGSVQQLWVADQLAHLPPSAKYLFFCFHHPAVADDMPGATHTTRPNEAEFGHWLEAQAPKLNARIVVVNGHIHNYSRFERGGVVYLISGGAGAMSYAVTRSADDLYKNPADINFHFVRFDFDGKQLNAVMRRVNQGSDGKLSLETRDSFVIAEKK